MAATDTAIDFKHAAPFWVSLLVVPLIAIAAIYGGWALLLPIAGTWWAFTGLDALIGRNTDNPDPPSAPAKWTTEFRNASCAFHRRPRSLQAAAYTH